MVVERELAIRAFVPQDYLEVVATFSPASGVSYRGTWFRGEDPTPEAKRLKAGFPYVLVNGVPVIDGGTHTGAKAGAAYPSRPSP